MRFRRGDLPRSGQLSKGDILESIQRIMRIRIIIILGGIYLLCGMSYGADFDPKRCTTIEELTAQGIPAPMDLISEMSDKKLGNVSQIFVTKLWYRLAPGQKKAFTLRAACRANLVSPGKNLQIFDGASGKKLTEVYDGKFMSFEK